MPFLTSSMFSLRRRKNETLTLQADTILTYSNEATDDPFVPNSTYKDTQQRLERAYLEDVHGAIMNANVQPPAAGRKVQRYTGFNEPFNQDRNTTLPHPDADTSPNATIEAPDLNTVSTRSRHSLRRGKSHTNHLLRHPLNRSKHSTGATSIGSDLSTMYDNIQYADGSVETKSKEEIEDDVEKREDIVRAPGAISGLVGGPKRRERLPNDSGVDMNLDMGEEESYESYKTEKKRGVLGKLGL